MRLSTSISRQVVVGVCWVVLAAAVARGGTYYAAPANASPAGLATNSGTISSPWDLQTALNKTATITAGSTLYLRGGTYRGTFSSSLAGSSSNPITVCSYPGEWAVLDGYVATTLASAITSTSSSYTLTNGANIKDYDVLLIGTINANSRTGVEQIRGGVRQGTTNTFTQAVRGWGGTTAIAHAAGEPVLVQNGGVLTINGSDTIYRDFEITTTQPLRAFNYYVFEEATGSIGSRPEGIFCYGPRSKFINLIIHDTQEGIGLWQAAAGAEVYGCLIFNNGIVDTLRGHGHGIYTQNNDTSATGKKKITNVISANNCATGMKAFGEAGYANGYIFDKIISFNNGSPAYYPGSPTGSSTHRMDNLFVGTGSNPPQNITVTNCALYHPLGKAGANLTFGYVSVSPGIGLVCQNNDVMGGTQALWVKLWNNVTMTNNTFYSDSFLASVHDKHPNSNDPNYANGIQLAEMVYTWNNNTYYNTGAGEYVFTFTLQDVSPSNAYGGGNLKFDETPTALGKGWRQWTGFDANSTYTRARPNFTKVVVNPNIHQLGRAHIAIYNWPLAASVNVDLSSAGLSNGQPFELRNIQNYFGSPVMVGTYNSSSPIVSVPMNSPEATAVATPFGHSFTPATTAPEFAALVCLPLNTPNSAPVAPGNLTAVPGNGQVGLSWAAVGNAVSYTLKRSTSSGGPYTVVQSGLSSTGYTNTGLSNGTTYWYVVSATNPFGQSMNSAPASATPQLPDTTPPTVLSASFEYLTAQHTLSVRFSEDVQASLAAADVQITDPFSGNPTSVSVSGVSYDSATHTATFNLSATPIPDGNYRATLLASGITDAAGNKLGGNVNYVFDFFHLSGDANRDRLVDVVDLGVVSSNWQASPRSWAEGDFNYDGLVDVVDLGIVASSWQASLAVPPAPAVATTDGVQSGATTAVKKNLAKGAKH